MSAIKTKLTPMDCKNIVRLFFNDKLHWDTIYKQINGKRGLSLEVNEAINCYTEAKSVADLTHEKLLSEAADRFKRFVARIRQLEDHDSTQVELADDECHSQVNPEADAYDGRDLSEVEVKINSVNKVKTVLQ
jgi:hypothetical protein